MGRPARRQHKMPSAHSDRTTRNNSSNQQPAPCLASPHNLHHLCSDSHLSSSSSQPRRHHFSDSRPNRRLRQTHYLVSLLNNSRIPLLCLVRTKINLVHRHYSAKLPRPGLHLCLASHHSPLQALRRYLANHRSQQRPQALRPCLVSRRHSKHLRPVYLGSPQRVNRTRHKGRRSLVVTPILRLGQARSVAATKLSSSNPLPIFSATLRRMLFRVSLPRPLLVAEDHCLGGHNKPRLVRPLAPKHRSKPQAHHYSQKRLNSMIYQRKLNARLNKSNPTSKVAYKLVKTFNSEIWARNLQRVRSSSVECTKTL